MNAREMQEEVASTWAFPDLIQLKTKEKNHEIV